MANARPGRWRRRLLPGQCVGGAPCVPWQWLVAWGRGRCPPCSLFQARLVLLVVVGEPSDEHRRLERLWLPVVGVSLNQLEAAVVWVFQQALDLFLAMGFNRPPMPNLLAGIESLLTPVRVLTCGPSPPLIQKMSPNENLCIPSVGSQNGTLKSPPTLFR